jgi:hypothetical protein
VEDSTSAGAKITLTGLSEVFITPLASDYTGFGAGGSLPFAIWENGTVPADSNLTNTSRLDPMTLADTVIDDDGLFTLSSNVLTCVVGGMYDFQATVYYTDASNFGNGVIYTFLDSDSTEVGPNNWPSLNVLTAADSAFGDLQFTFSGPIALEAGDTVNFITDNFSGGTISLGLTEVRAQRLGNA